MIRLIVLFTLLLTSAPTVFAQHEHSVSHSNLIDGSAHPELIPDSSAYRMYFIVVSEMPNASAEAQKRQLSHLGKIGLSDEDEQTTIAALNNFKVQYSDLMAQYNASATLDDAVGRTPDLAGFLIRRDGLVQALRDELKQKLSAQGMAQFDAHVQGEKKHMKVPAKEAQ